MTRKKRARIVIDTIREIAALHGIPLSGGGGSDRVTSILVQRHASWKAVISTSPPAATENDLDCVSMRCHISIWALGYEVLNCDFDEDELRIFKFMQGPWDQMIFDSVRGPPDLPCAPADS